MMNDHQLEEWLTLRSRPPETTELIKHIRCSEPSRRVDGGMSNVTGDYPSKKMGMYIQCESNKVERVFVHQCENSEEVIEFYDQPPSVKLTYQSPNKRGASAMKTFDYFLLMKDGEAGWLECKKEEWLVEQDGIGPYVRNGDGTWSFPPGEEYARKFGLFCKVWSTAEANWILDRNYTYLDEYLRDGTTILDPERTARIISVVNAQQGIELKRLCDMKDICTRDEILLLISRGILHVDLAVYSLSDEEKTRIFTSKELAKALSQTTTAPPRFMLPAQQISFDTGSQIKWAGVDFTILNNAENKVFLKNNKGEVITLGFVSFEKLVIDGEITGETSLSAPDDSLSEELKKAGKEELDRANARLETVRIYYTCASGKTPRNARRWIKKYREAERVHGVGFIGLIDKTRERGNRTERIADAVIELLRKTIDEEYLNPRQITKKAAYQLFEEACKTKGLDPASYKTFAKVISSLDSRYVTLCRQGRRAEYQVTPPVIETEKTLPRHGERPWEIVHIDHTQIDMELIDSVTKEPLGRPWLTLMIDAHTRRVLAFFLSFEPPSYRSCLMVIREVVYRFNRLPTIIMVDNGKEFKSLYFDALIAAYQITRKNRPPAQPRFGSIVERAFRTIHTQFIYTLTGNTQITKDVRKVTKSVNPKNTATWTFSEFNKQLEKYLYEIYDSRVHSSLGESPREAYERGMELHGNRPSRIVSYNENFVISTLPTTEKGTAKVVPCKGIKVKRIFYWNEEFSSPAVASTNVDVRYDPFDIGYVYAFVNGSWVKCFSRYYAELQGLTEHELKAISAEIQRRDTIAERKASDFDQIIAQFILENREKENTLLAQKRAAESKPTHRPPQGTTEDERPDDTASHLFSVKPTETYDDLG